MRQARQRWATHATVDERRDEILKSLAAIVREKGPSSLKMEDIAARLGLVKGNLYYYFKNKQDIFYHCHVKCMHESLAALETAERANGSTAERLRSLLTRHIRGMIDSPYGGVLLTDLDNLTPVQRRRYVKMRDQFEQGVRRLIQRGVAKGEFTPCDPRLAGFLILGAVNWIPKWYHPQGPASSTQIARQFAEQFMRSLKA